MTTDKISTKELFFLKAILGQPTC